MELLQGVNRRRRSRPRRRRGCNEVGAGRAAPRRSAYAPRGPGVRWVRPVCIGEEDVSGGAQTVDRRLRRQLREAKALRGGSVVAELAQSSTDVDEKGLVGQRGAGGARRRSVAPLGGGGRNGVIYNLESAVRGFVPRILPNHTHKPTCMSLAIHTIAVTSQYPSANPSDPGCVRDHVL